MAERGRGLGLVGAPIDFGAGRTGARMGPDALRVAGLTTRLNSLGHAVRDDGNLLIDNDHVTDRLGSAVDVARRLSAKTYEMMAEGLCPVILGGDHALSMGSVAGVARATQERGQPLHVLWIDAHADYNTPSISPSGNPHGMSLALLCGEQEFAPFIDSSWHAQVDPYAVTIFGARSIDRAERALLRERGVDVVDMRLIDEMGAGALMRQAIERAAHAGAHLHVSFDVDVLDPTLAPGVGTTVPGGLTFREAHLIMEMLHDSGLVGSLDVVELNPFMDHAGRSAELLVDLVGSLFGQQIFDRTVSTRQPAIQRAA